VTRSQPVRTLWWHYLTLVFSNKRHLIASPCTPFALKLAAPPGHDHLYLKYVRDHPASSEKCTCRKCNPRQQRHRDVPPNESSLVHVPSCRAVVFFPASQSIPKIDLWRKLPYVARVVSERAIVYAEACDRYHYFGTTSEGGSKESRDAVGQTRHES
jgi:hypothetical protein